MVNDAKARATATVLAGVPSPAVHERRAATGLRSHDLTLHHERYVQVLAVEASSDFQRDGVTLQRKLRGAQLAHRLAATRRGVRVHVRAFVADYFGLPRDGVHTGRVFE